LSAADFRARINDSESAIGWPILALSNHDMPRAYTRFALPNATEAQRDAIGKLLATMLLTLRGTPLLYYGEEIGMANNDPTRVEDVKDPVGRRFWPKDKGRDGERTPMQWSDATNAGFTTGTPWLPLPPSYATHNVAAEEQDPRSMLNWYRGLIALRRAPAMLDGKYVPLLANDPNVLAYRREGKNGRAFTVLLNMSATEQHLALPWVSDSARQVMVADSLAQRPFACNTAHLNSCALAGDQLALAPYQAVILEDVR
jgi:alpha-glucosidase